MEISDEELEKIAEEILLEFQHDCSAPISPKAILKHLQKIRDRYEKKIKELKKAAKDALDMYLDVK